MHNMPTQKSAKICIQVKYEDKHVLFKRIAQLYQNNIQPEKRWKYLFLFNNFIVFFFKSRIKT